MQFRLRSFIPAVAALVAFAATQTAAYVHYLWITVADGKARVALLEKLTEAPHADFEKYVANLSFHTSEKTLVLGEPKNGARYADLPADFSAGKDSVTTESTVGITERNNETYLLVYQAKGAASLAAAGQAASGPVELLARRDGAALVVSVRQNGKTVPKSDVWVQWPGAEDPVSVQTDLSGQVRVPWSPSAGSTPSQTGFVGVRTMVSEAKAGETAGKKYAFIHRWATLTFPVTGPQAAVAAAEKPFRQILRASFGDNHETVSNAAFNQTVFDGKLTKKQLEIHFQQRALIHNELHRILIGADPALHVPYGAAQKNVLVLLFSDLITIGSGWPTEAQARPLTQAFLKDIRDSEKQGPYFALGVQHVYYGGITNGGRTIGEKIGETLKFTPTYYEKSDGYPDYLPLVDKIADPKARQEMIRGGQAAYRYIIASSNEDVFKAK